MIITQFYREASQIFNTETKLLMKKINRQKNHQVSSDLKIISKSQILTKQRKIRHLYFTVQRHKRISEIKNAKMYFFLKDIMIF